MQLQDAYAAAKAGKALLLVGAGFALESRNSEGRALPSGEQLADDLMREIDGDEGSDFGLAAQLYEKAYGGDPGPLHSFLNRRLSVTSVSDDQTAIAALPWRRIYTTNFDNSLELARSLRNEPFESVNPTLNPADLPRGKTWIVHLHGSVTNLREKSKADLFALTKTSYINPKLLYTPWPSQLQTDIEASSAVFIIGYSLSDFHIAKLLRNSTANRRKTFIVTKPNPSKGFVAYAEDFGTVLSIGMAGLSSAISSAEVFDSSKFKDGTRYNFREYFLSDHPTPPTPDDVIELFISGRFNDAAYLNQKLNPDRPYTVNRQISRELIWKGEARRVLIYGGIGNGKTLYLSQLAIDLIQSNLRPFLSHSSGADAYFEFDSINKEDGSKAFIFDGIRENERLIKYVSQNLGSTDMLIVAARPSDFANEFLNVENVLGAGHIALSLDVMRAGEIAELDKILEYHGLWGNLSDQTAAERRRFIEEECGAELRSVVLHSFRNSVIGERISQPLSAIKAIGGETELAFAALMAIRLADCPLDFIDVCQLIEVDPIELGRTFARTGADQFFPEEKDNLRIRSSVLAQFLISNALRAEASANAIYRLSSRLVEFQNADWRFEDSLPKLLRFSVITRIFSDHNRRGHIVELYEKLLDISFLREDPQFWLQFAIARMEEEKFDLAGKCLETAYALAKRRLRYRTYMLDNQMARWLLLSRIYDPSFDDPDHAAQEAGRIIRARTEAMKGSIDNYTARLSVPLMNFLRKFKGHLSETAYSVLNNARVELRDKLRAANAAVGLTKETERYLRMLESNI